VGVTAALLSQTVPAMTRMKQAQQRRGVADTLATDLHLARSEAMRIGHPVFFRVSGKGANACYLLHAGARNDRDCAGGQVSCPVPGSTVLRAEWLPAGRCSCAVTWRRCSSSTTAAS